MPKERTESLETIAPATFSKYQTLNCLIPFKANNHASLLVNILFENNIFALASSINDPVLVRSSYSQYGERLRLDDEVFLRGYAIFSCGKEKMIFKKQMDLPPDSAKGLNYLQIIKIIEARPKYRHLKVNHRVEPFTDALTDERLPLIKHVLNCPDCYKRMSKSADFLDFKKIALSVKALNFNLREVSVFTKSDFDSLITNLESQITELKAKYPEFVEHQIVGQIEPKGSAQIIEQKNLFTQNDGETQFTDILEFIQKNNIQIHTRKQA
jgi:hypothetical protein